MQFCNRIQSHVSITQWLFFKNRWSGQQFRNGDLSEEFAIAGCISKIRLLAQTELTGNSQKCAVLIDCRVPGAGHGENKSIQQASGSLAYVQTHHYCQLRMFFV